MRPSPKLNQTGKPKSKHCEKKEGTGNKAHHTTDRTRTIQPYCTYLFMLNITCKVAVIDSVSPSARVCWCVGGRRFPTYLNSRCGVYTPARLFYEIAVNEGAAQKIDKLCETSESHHDQPARFSCECESVK